MATGSADRHLTRACHIVTLMKFFHSGGGNKTDITDARIVWDRVETGCIMSTQSLALRTLVDIYIKKEESWNFFICRSRRDVYAASPTNAHCERISGKINGVRWGQETIQALAVKAAICVHAFCIFSTDPNLIRIVFTAFAFIVVFMKDTEMDKSESKRLSVQSCKLSDNLI